MSEIEKILNDKGVYVLTTLGDSMWPTIKSGRDKVAVILPENGFKKNDIILYKSNGKTVLHRIVQIEKDFVLTKGDNYKKIDRINFSDIIGIADGIFKGEKYFKLDSFYMRLRFFTWKIISPIIFSFRKQG